ncbi:hypothetical protein CEUSTIGMA_g9425.t1 [Chlamydomonas eustigma]|uniref:Thioesterase domain-containing protein n=1 Tax=Chlamydomonas eustigma TaxID=1157962 RepID=A0A250XFZ7_9CHLO|nr:hypothetical protein CEUSTIGMA_g9425.t1 [Chlamydomonas eustigma]|eukprot:GAX81997.1 hypothetical protein CEUSTIGMA_g9425.t1 [Chlamydomonas eustigma]
MATVTEMRSSFEKPYSSVLPANEHPAHVFNVVSNKETERSCAVKDNGVLTAAAPLETLPWLKQLIPDFQIQPDILKMEGGPIGHDHMLKNMARNGQIIDNKILFRKGAPVLQVSGSEPNYESQEVPSTCSQQMELLNVYQLGGDVAGHKGLVHGGLTATIFDETFGYLLYGGKAAGLLSFGMVLTAQLNVSYAKPVPAGSVVACTACVTSMEGRKIWVTAKLQEKYNGDITFATATALFIIPKA